MSLAGLANQYGSSDSSDDDHKASDDENAILHAIHPTKADTGSCKKRSRAENLGPSNPKKSRLSAQKESHSSVPGLPGSSTAFGRFSPKTDLMLQPPPPQLSLFQPEAERTQRTLPPAPRLSPPQESADHHDKPPPPEFGKPQEERALKDSIPFARPGVTTSSHFLPPQVRTKRPNLSTEDLTSYGCKKINPRDAR